MLALLLSQAGHAPTLLDSAESSLAALESPGIELCHVTVADDGQWHRRLEARGIAHTGSSAEGIELAASRAAARQFLMRFDVPTPGFVLLRSCVSPLEAVARVASLGYPLLVRADGRQCSGVRVLKNADELSQSLPELFRDTDRILVERMLRGQAWSIVLQGEQALPPVPSHVVDEETSEQQPLNDLGRRRLEHAASMAAVALGLSGLVQVEAVLDYQGRPWVLEVNPSPSIVEGSVAARAAAAARLPLGELCQWMVQDCLMAESMR
jgi:D-alanine-D-alanine ligase